MHLDITLTHSATTEARRRLGASAEITGKPMAAALVFWLASPTDADVERVGSLDGYWDLGTYEVESLPPGCHFRVGDLNWAWEDIPTMRHLLGKTIDWSQGKRCVSARDA